jgi:hypothetical protein
MNCPFCNPELDKEQQITLHSTHCMFLQKPQPILKGSRRDCSKHPQANGV